MLLTNLMKYQK